MRAENIFGPQLALNPKWKTLSILVAITATVCNAQTKPANSPSAIYERTHESVVVIVSADKDAKPTGQGSGFIVSKNRVVTNHHVIDGAAVVIVVFADGGASEIDGIAADSPARDITILSVYTGKRPALSLGDELSVRQGDPVYAVGAPRGLELSITNGIVSGFRHIDEEFMIQNTAPIAPGSSGGPLFDGEGRVIGVTTSLLTDSPGIYFSVGVEHVRRLLRTTPNIVLAPLPTPPEKNEGPTPAPVPTSGSNEKSGFPPKSSVFIDTEPAGAAVFINGTKQTPQTPATIPLTPGQYNVVLRLPGYIPYAASVHVEEGPPKQVSAELRKDISGTYRGTVYDSTGKISATFGIFIRHEGETIRGCMDVQRPRYGSGSLRGSIENDVVTFTTSSSTFQITFRGIRMGEKITGKYKVTFPYPQVGEFDLEKSASDAPSAGFDISNCPVDSPNT